MCIAVVLVHAVVVFLWSSVGTSAALISSSRLEHCVNDGGSTSAEPIPCQMKFVVSLAVQGGQGNTESVASWSTALGPNGKVYRLTNPVNISLRKSEALMRYPVAYVRNFNAQPKENVIYTGTMRCRADATDTSPTCGRAYDSQGAPIPFSEGFCCSCSVCDLFGLCKDDSRANIDCAILGNGAAASCLTFSDLWYSGFSIGPAETWYRIIVTIQQHGKETIELELGPDVLGANSQLYGVSAELIGDFSPFKQPLNLESKMLLIPTFPQSHPRALKGSSEWMLVPQSLVTKDGTGCNKIGVSYEAFAGQGSRCELAVGSCLANQPEDLRTEDMEKHQSGETGDYMVDNFGEFALYGSSPAAAADSSTHRSFEPRQVQRPYIAYRVSNVQQSLVALTFVADDISYTVNVATGKILSCNISDFEANSKNGKLTVIIMSTGNVPADFQITVRDCTEGTFPVSADVDTLYPMTAKKISFNIWSENFAGQANNCNVTLYDSLHNVVDSVLVRWNSTDTVIDTGAQGGDNGAGGSAVLPRGNAGSDSSSCTSCPFYNPICFVTRRCFWQIIIQIAVCILVLFLIVWVFRHRKCLCPCLFSDDKDDRRKEQQKKREEEPVRQEPSPTAFHHPPMMQPMYNGPQYVGFCRNFPTALSPRRAHPSPQYIPIPVVPYVEPHHNPRATPSGMYRAPAALSIRRTTQKKPKKPIMEPVALG